MSTLTTVVDDLVAASRILAGLGVLDGFGHVSVRHPVRADRYLLARSLAPELVTRDDIMTVDMASAPQNGDTRTPYLERFIHGEIFVQRPDVICVVHSHAATVGRRQHSGGGLPRVLCSAQCRPAAARDLAGRRRNVSRRRGSTPVRRDQPQRDRTPVGPVESGR